MASLVSIEITTPATKLAYKVGDTLDIVGLIVTGTYDDTTTQVETVTETDVTGFDSSAVTAAQTLTVTVGLCTTTYDISVAKADGLPLTGVTANNATNTMSGMTSAMEYSVDSGVTWTTFDTTISPNLPDLTGTLSLQVRYKTTATHEAGAATTFTFTPLNAILPIGYETQVRTDMGVTASILSDTAIQSKAVLAEALIKKAVPTYASKTGDELTFLQSACIAQVCALLCPGMPSRIKIAETSETGYSYRLQDVDWVKRKVEFEEAIGDMVNLSAGGEAVYFSPIGVVTNDRLEI